MKKFVTALFVVLALSCSTILHAQQDDFFQGKGIIKAGAGETPETPNTPGGHGLDDDQGAPLGNGLLLLASLAGAYTIRKRYNNK